MRILLVNDDGIHAAGLIALEKFLRPAHEVFTVAPASEQSGISQAITFLRPLFPQKVFDGNRLRGFCVDGTPADCVKLAMFELCPWKPEIVISGINGGLNAGINVLYSGTIGGAMEAAMYGHVSFAVSLEYDEPLQYDRAAPAAWEVIERILEQEPQPGRVYNINIPTAALDNAGAPVVVPMETSRFAYEFEKGQDPKGRHYFWSTNDPPPKPSEIETDAQALALGKISVTPLEFDVTDHPLVKQMHDDFVQAAKS